jgi:uncharacterized protein (TIGR02646 family)
MIKIDKSTVQVPEILSKGKGFKETQTMKSKFDEDGTNQFDFKNKNYWGHESVKTALMQIQNDKCCYCERRRPHTIEGDVEHFRPKSHYFWLAFDFSNLFFSCKTCNSIYKKAKFPLANESMKAKSYHADLSLEENLILHPEFDNIEEHITFDGAEARPKNDSSKGETTINSLELNNPKLLKERFEYLEILFDLREVAKQGNLKAIDRFREIAKPDKIFSWMIRCNFSDILQQ